METGLELTVVRLSKREFFAALAMQAIIANPDWPGEEVCIAKDAVACADALLAALKGEE